jgi:hypothetical protein
LFAALCLWPLIAGPQDAWAPIDLRLPAGVFSEGNDTDRTIFGAIESLIDAVPPGEAIYLNVYYYDDQGITEHLEAAAERGVRVHALLDGRSLRRNRPAVRRLQELAAEFIDFGIEHVNHHKYVLFSRVRTQNGLVSGVVFQTSSNFTGSDSRKAQNAVILGDIGLYERYRRNWVEMSQARSAEEAGSVDAAPYTGGAATLYLSPVRDGDPVIDFLDGIPRDARNCAINIAHSRWTNSARGRRIAAALGRLAATCDIDVAGRFFCDENLKPRGCTGDVAEAIWEQLREAGIARLHRLCANELNVHSKYLLASYVEAEGAARDIVLTGSPNFTGTGLASNHEALLKIQDAALHRAYQANFERLRGRGMQAGDTCDGASSDD